MRYFRTIKLNRTLLLFDNYLSNLLSEHYFNGSPQVIYYNSEEDEIIHINYTHEYIGVLIENLPSYMKDIEFEYLHNSIKELTGIEDYKICVI